MKPTYGRAAGSPRFLAALSSMIMLVGCGEATPELIVPDPVEGDMAAALAVIPSWESVSPPVAASVDPVEGDMQGSPGLLPDTDPRYNPLRHCTVTPYNLAKNPQSIVTLTPDIGLLVPGTLIQGRTHVLGALQQLQIAARAPIDLIINESGVEFPARTVENPSLASLQTAVNSLIQEAETSGFDYGSEIVYEHVTSHSFEQAALALDFSARYLNTSVRGQLGIESSTEKTTVTAKFVQDAFSIRADGPQLAQDWFTSELTQDAVDGLVAAGHIGPDNPPLYVLEVTYGRIVTVSFKSTASEKEIDAIFEAGKNGRFREWSAEVDASQQTIIEGAEIGVVSLGGPAAGGFQFMKEILDPDDDTAIGLDGFFAQDVSLTTFVPISYTLADLRTGAIAKVGEITDYEQLTCAGLVSNDFENGSTQGWTEARDVTDGYPNWWGLAHAGDGGLRTLDDGAGISYLDAPSAYLGDISAYYGGGLSYWALWICTGGDVLDPLNTPPWACDGGVPLSSENWPDVRIESASSPKILVMSAGPDDVAEDTWVLRTASFAPGPNTRVYNPTAGETIADAVQASEADILEVLEDVSRFELRGELRSSEREYVFFDDIGLVPPTS